MNLKLFNLVLRGSSLGGKFLLIFYLAKILTPVELGVYGLLVSTMSYSIYLLGLDFYTYSNRELARSKKESWPSILRDQGILYSLSYLISIPFLCLLFIFDVLPIEFLLIFIILLVVEHLSQEVIRLLIIIGRPVAAGVLLFIRSGLWCYLIILIYLLGLGDLSLSNVFVFWILSDILTLFLSMWLLRGLLWEKAITGINWKWIKKGLRTALLFLVGTLAIRGIFTFDRYLIKTYSGEEMLGIYTLYIGLTNSILVFVDAAIFSFQYPKLIKEYKNGSFSSFKSLLRKFTKQTLFGVVLISATVAIMSLPVLRWVGNPIYLENLKLLYLLLISSVIFVVSHIPHYGLYAMEEDKSIVQANIKGLIVFIASGFILSYLLGELGVAISILVSTLYIGVSKYCKLLQKFNKE